MFKRLIFNFFSALCVVIVTIAPANAATACICPYDRLHSHDLIRKVRSDFSGEIQQRQALLGTKYNAVALVSIAKERLESAVFKSSEPDWSLVVRYVLLGHGYNKGVNPSLKASVDDLHILKSGYAISSAYRSARGDIRPIQAGQVHTTSSESIQGHVNALNQVAASVPGETRTWAEDICSIVDPISKGSKNETTIPEADLAGCHAIKVVKGAQGNPIAHVVSTSPIRNLAQAVAKEVGVDRHLAPQVTIDGVVYEKFITLFRTPADESMLSANPIACELKQHCGKYGDLTIKRLLDKAGELKTRQLLQNIDSDSIDELFLHHIITSADDSTPRNFLLQYANGKLRLVRIDYSASIFGASLPGCFHECFLATYLKDAALQPFGPRAQSLICTLSMPQRGTIWHAHPPEYFAAYRTRIQILKLMSEAGLFDKIPRADTMLFMCYINLRIDCNSFVHESFVDMYALNQHSTYEKMSSPQLSTLGAFLSVVRDNLRNYPKRVKITQTEHNHIFIQNAIEEMTEKLQETPVSGMKMPTIFIQRYMPLLKKGLQAMSAPCDYIPDLLGAVDKYAQTLLDS